MQKLEDIESESESVDNEELPATKPQEVQGFKINTVIPTQNQEEVKLSKEILCVEEKQEPKVVLPQRIDSRKSQELSDSPFRSLTNDFMNEMQGHSLYSDNPLNPPDESFIKNLTTDTKRKVVEVELHDKDIEKILDRPSTKKRLKKKKSKMTLFESSQMISRISSTMTDEVLKGICSEIIDADFISNLILDELKL